MIKIQKDSDINLKVNTAVVNTTCFKGATAQVKSWLMSGKPVSNLTDHERPGPCASLHLWRRVSQVQGTSKKTNQVCVMKTSLMSCDTYVVSQF